MKHIWAIASIVMIALVVLLLSILAEHESAPSPPATATAPATQPLRIGLIPDRDILTLRRRHRILGDYIGAQLGRPVQLVTVNSYDAILKDFGEKQVDAAFLGSLVAVLAVDRLDARMVVRTELPGGIHGYRGVICVRSDSGISSVKQLSGKKIALVRTTTGGNLFPFEQFIEHGLIGDQAPQVIWCGTHDEAVQLLADRAVDAAGVKDLRLYAWQQENPNAGQLTIIAVSDLVPENTLIVRGDLSDDLLPRLQQILLGMEHTSAGREVLKQYGATRFAPVQRADFAPICRMVKHLGGRWSELGIEGPPPDMKGCKQP